VLISHHPLAKFLLLLLPKIGCFLNHAEVTQQVLDWVEFLSALASSGFAACFVITNWFRYFALLGHIPTAIGISMSAGLQLQISIYLTMKRSPRKSSFLTQAEKLGEVVWSTALVAADELVKLCMAG